MKLFPEISIILQDMIAGFPTETEEDHQDTLSLMEHCKYDFHSCLLIQNVQERLAEEKWMMMFRRNKARRLNEIIDLQTKNGIRSHKIHVRSSSRGLNRKRFKKSFKFTLVRKKFAKVQVVFPIKLETIKLDFG